MIANRKKAGRVVDKAGSIEETIAPLDEDEALLKKHIIKNGDDNEVASNDETLDHVDETKDGYSTKPHTTSILTDSTNTSAIIKMKRLRMIVGNGV